MNNAMPDRLGSFQDKQNEFAAYIRDPFSHPLPDDVKQQRMETYRALFFNNVNSFLISNFPVLHRILDEQQWVALAQDFFSNHVSKSPYFSEIPEEFIHYLQDEREAVESDPPFMLELAHYEWVEMAITIAKSDAPETDQIFKQSPQKYQIALSPLAWPLAYQYPVHRITPDFQPKQPPAQPTYLVVYRNSAFEVRFLAISPLTFRMLQILQEQPRIAADACLDQLVQEAAYPDPQLIVDGGIRALKELAAKGIVVEGN